MNLKKLVCGFFLSTALAAGIGVFAGIQKAEAKNVDATTSRALTGGDTVYCINYSNWSGTFYAHFWDTNTGTDITSWPGNQMTKVGTMSGHDLWSITVPKKNSINPNHVIFNNNSGSQTGDLWTTASGKNMVYNNTSNDYVDSTVCKITKKKWLGSTESAIGTEYIQGTSWTVPKQSYESNYIADGWYKSDKSTKVTGTYSGCDWETTVYSKYTSHGAWSGTVNLDLRDSGWAGAAANYAIYLMNKNTYSSEAGGWSSYVTGIASGEHLVQVSYSVGFDPNYLYIFRYNPNYSQASWNNNKTPTGDNKWGQSQDIAFNEMIRVGDSLVEGKNAVYGGYPKFHRWTPDADVVYLDTVKSNKSHNAEYYSTSISLQVNQEFKVQVAPYADGDYYGSYSTHSSLTSNFRSGSGGNVKCLVAGTYAIYFDSITNSIYITTQAISAADEFAESFLTQTSAYCTSSVSSSVQTALKGEYDALASISGAQAIFYGAEVKRGKGLEYDTSCSEAISRYVNMQEEKGYTDFLGLGAHNPKGAIVNPIINLSNNGSGTTLIIITVCTVALASVGGYFLFKKKHQ